MLGLSQTELELNGFAIGPVPPSDEGRKNLH